MTDTYNAGFGVTIVLGGPPAFFSTMRELDIIDESCAADGPLMIVPSHGFPQSLEDSIVELEELGVDVGCN